jgi:hypothetical protein
VANENEGVAQRKWKLEVFATDTGIEPFSAIADELEDFEWAALDAALRAYSPSVDSTLFGPSS